MLAGCRCDSINRHHRRCVADNDMNLSTTDRLLRLILGGLLLSGFFLVHGGLHWAGLLGLVPLATASLGWCPVYEVLGLDTRMGHEGGPHE